MFVYSFVQLILIFSFVRYKPVEYGGNLYPVWADAIGWMLALASNIPIVVVAVIMLCTATGSTWRQVSFEVLRNKTQFDLWAAFGDWVCGEIVANQNLSSLLPLMGLCSCN